MLKSNTNGSNTKEMTIKPSHRRQSKEESVVELEPEPEPDPEELKQDEKLIQFLDDFVNSEEFEDFIKKHATKEAREKKRCVDAAVNVEADFEEYRYRQKFPMTVWSREVRDFQRRFENYLENKMTRKALEMQKKSIANIRVRIAERINELYGLYVTYNMLRAALILNLCN